MAEVKKKTIEIVKGKPRKEEEKFDVQFSEKQSNAILLIILAATFLVQGVVRYLEFLDKLSFVKPWLVLIILSLIFLTLSIVSINVGGIIAPLRMKRKMNLISFGSFVIGFLLFFGSLIFLLYIIR